MQFPNRADLRTYIYKNFSLLYDCELNDFSNVLDRYFGKSKTSSFQRGSYLIKQSTWKNYAFPTLYFSDETELDIELNIFVYLSGISEYGVSKDNHDRATYADSLIKELGVIHTPVVNILYQRILEKFKEENIPITLLRFKQSVVMTHDIDQLRSGWFETIRKEFNSPTIKSFINIPIALFTKIFGLKDDHFKGLEKSIEVNQQQKLSPIYFFMTKKSHQDADYNEELLKKAFRLIPSDFRIGIHPGYYTSTNEEEFLFQKNRLENLIDRKIDSCRQHYLKYDVKITPHIHEKASIREDYSLGFAEIYGFRNGICSPFYLYNFKEQRAFYTKQIPLFLMDSTLFSYLDPKDLQINKKESSDIIKQLQADFPFCISVLFHNTWYSNQESINFIISLAKLNQ